MLWKVMSGKMELSCDGWKFAEDDLGAWVGLDSLTDRRKSVGTEEGVGSATTTQERDADGDRLLGVETRGAHARGLCGFNKTMARD